MEQIRKHGTLLLMVLGGLLVCSAAAGLCIGAEPISLGALLEVLSGADTQSTAYRIIYFVRLPRVVGAILAGSALAVSGCILQALLANPLASPNVIGVNSGAGLGVLLCAVAFPTAIWLLPIAAFLGALLTSLLVFLMAMGGASSQSTIVLTGIAATSVLGAGINTILIIDPDAYVGSSTFLVGGLIGVTMRDIAPAAIYIFLGLGSAVLLSRALDVLSLGEDMARSLGMRLHLYRGIFIITAAILAGAAISFAGLVGFVGLLVPHMVRFVVGNSSRYLLPASALGGAVFVLLCDLLARTVFSPYELPVGILMSFLGGPFFIYLVIKMKRGRRYA